MPAVLDPVSGAPAPGSVLRPDPDEHDRPDRSLLQAPGQEPESEQETWEPAALPGDVKHVPFGGLTLASAVNGVTYQHTLGALDNRSGQGRSGHRAGQVRERRGAPTSTPWERWTTGQARAVRSQVRPGRGESTNTPWER